ncbi:MAG: hypothetical protein V1831_00430 [Candidatus Woesearchaeota archaeon]
MKTSHQTAEQNTISFLEEIAAGNRKLLGYRSGNLTNLNDQVVRLTYISDNSLYVGKTLTFGEKGEAKVIDIVLGGDKKYARYHIRLTYPK